ncbi:hypothetical protein LJR034_008677 [Caballeronia sp. LjRoot34]|uniref:hypothetical protein n=1 Tax=Caballeronia sp. LjRoot34 TaxID=3342325 RepID=UPI003ED160AE
MKKFLLFALSVCYASLACAQSLPLQNTAMSVTGTPKITSEDGQSIRVVNTKGSASLAKVSAGDSCSTTGLLMEGAAGNTLLTCASGKWRDLRDLDQAAVQMTIDGPDEGTFSRHIQYAFVAHVGIPTLQTTEEAGFRVFRSQSGFVQPTKTADSLYVDTNVLAFNPDNTAHLLIELTSMDAAHEWTQRVDVTVPLGVKTAIAKDGFGVEYAVRVTKRAS